MTGLGRTFRSRFCSLLLAGVGFVAVTVGSEGVSAQSLPWPDANPVMRLDRPASRAHRSRPHRAVRHHGIHPKRVLKPAANATVLKPVAAGSATAANGPSAVPLPTARSVTEVVGDDTKAKTATRSSKPSGDPGALKASALSVDAAAPSPDSSNPDKAARTAVSADRPTLPVPSAVPKPEKPPAELARPDEAPESKPAANDGGSVPSPKPAEGADASIARSGLDAVPPKSDTPQNPDVKSDTRAATKTGAAAVRLDDAASSPASLPDADSVKRDRASAESLPITDIPLPERRPDTPATRSGSPASSGATESPPKAEAPNSTEKLKSRVPEVTPATMVAAAAAIEDAKSCERELKKRGVVFTIGESIAEGECGVLRPVELKTLSSGVSITPTTFLLCRAALALDHWMSDSVVPIAKSAFPDDELKTFRHASTYVCRPRASEGGISEHARGSAIDIGGFTFASGRSLGIAAQEDGSPEAKFQRAVREAACGPFKTVLGPGTDPDHATHFHLDIAARRNGATYCK